VLPHTRRKRSPSGAARNRILRGARSSSGQAALETMLSMYLVILFIWGLVHLSMMMVTKYMVNYAAFCAARTAMVRGTGASEVQESAQQALEIVQWWGSGNDKNIPDVEYDAGRGGIVVQYHIPFGSPIFTTFAASGLVIEGFAPVTEQPSIPEKGDNAR
jgi:hypothetical protein